MDFQLYQKNLIPPKHLTISYPRDNTHIIITWNEVRNPDKYMSVKTVNKVYYNVYKGLSRNGIFYKLNNAPIATNRFEDYDMARNPNIQNWYKVSAVYEDENGQQIEGALSEPQCFEVRNTDKWFYKINERNLWILKNTGMLFDLYTRKYDGEHCPRCYDEIRGRAGTLDCDICYGTGYVGGYDPAYQLYVRLKPIEQALNVSTQMYTFENSPGAWTITTTKIMNRDVLISPTGTIYQVVASMINQAAGYLFHTELKLKACDLKDPIYQMKRTPLYPLDI